MPTISIIVPVYKVEKYIHRCVDSILNQTYRDFELILVDDGSPDNCGAICDEYAAKDSRIRVVHKTNGGLSSARNAGIDIAQGNYIMFCDSDDYVAEDWCEQFVRKTTETEDNYIFGGIKTVHLTEHGERFSDNKPGNIANYPVSDYLMLQAKGIVGFACNVLYYASILKERNLRFSEEVIVEDLPFNLNYLRYVDSLTYTGESGYYYFQDERETLSRKYYPELFRKWQEKYQATQYFIDEVIPKEAQEENRKTVADKYLYLFLKTLENTFDKRNPKSFAAKIRYNQSVVESVEFQHCLHCANADQENPRVINLLKKKKYFAVYLLERMAKTKRLITGGK